jgi:uncharacterized membrane protein YgdD (TMEM256/DUF423 family)
MRSMRASKDDGPGLSARHLSRAASRPPQDDGERNGRYSRRMDQILIALTGLMGAAGIMLTAAGAHSKPGVGLDSAGYLLLIHALAVIGGVLLARQGIILRPLGLIVLWGFVVGAALFGGDVAARAYLGSRLFPFAAPSGGLIMIASWLTLIAAALATLRG